MPRAAAAKSRRWPADHVERRPLASLKGYGRNARTHSDGQIAAIANSIKEWGWTTPVLIDEKNTVIAGHARIAASRQLGLTEVPVMVASGWTEEQKNAYRIADNQLAIAGSGWDMDMLRVEVSDLMGAGFDLGLMGFDELQIGDLLAPRTDGLTDPDEAPEPPGVPVSRLGDVWTLGSHTLVCGDATSEVDVSLALHGVKPHLMVTDPPYGVSLDPTWRDRAGANTKGRSGRGGGDFMEGGKTDTAARWDAVWALSPADVFYVWCASGPNLVDVYHSLDDTGYDVRQLLIWDKGVLTLTRTHYWYTHEHCLYGVRKGKTAHWIGKAGQSSVWSIPSPKHIMGGSKEKNEPHPAQKPVECMKRPIENNSSAGQAVYDPFVGSGTTIIAAEMTGRACHAIELHPPYADVSILRWQNFTGKEATLAATGQSYAEVAAEREAQPPQSSAVLELTS